MEATEIRSPMPQTNVSKSLKVALSVPLFTVFVMSLVKFIEMATDQSFGYLGVIPHNPRGLIGIVTGPLVHGDLQHLMNNAVSLVLFGTATFYFYRRIAIKVWLLIYFVSGALIWLFARGGHSHIGISGVVYGLAFFLFFGGLFRRNRRLAAISLMLTLFYGSMIWGVLPGDPKISWEGHLMGALMGSVLAIFYRNSYAGIEHFDPPRKLYNGPDLIGDEWKLPEPEVIEYGISYPNSAVPESAPTLPEGPQTTSQQPIRIQYIYRPTNNQDTTQPE